MEVPPNKMEVDDPEALDCYDHSIIQTPSFMYSSGNVNLDLLMQQRCSLDGRSEQNPINQNYTSLGTSSFDKPPEQQNRTDFITTWDYSGVNLIPSDSPSPSPSPSSSSSSSRIISFGNSASPPTPPPALKSESSDYYPYLNSDAALLEDSSKRPAGGSGRSRTAAHAQDHVIAERKRREKLSQRFIDLAALVPGRKKMDKASILGDATKYLQHLEERVKSLEEQTAGGKEAMESVAVVKKFQVHVEDEYRSSTDENRSNNTVVESPLPEIEARVSSDGQVLIRIHCERQKGSLSNVLAEIEKHGLSVINSTVLPFGSSILDITLVARQMEVSDLPATMRDLVKILHQLVR